MKDGNSKRGFTIVELLIVIVVIAILAAISIVAFVGIQTRAENTKTINAVSAIARSFSALAAESGEYPGPAGGAWVCLPTAREYCGTNQNNPSCFGLNRTQKSDAIVSHLATVTSSVPDVSSQEIDCGDGRVVTGGFYRLWGGNKAVTLFYFLKGTDVDCGDIGGLNTSKTVLGDATRCQVGLPVLS